MGEKDKKNKKIDKRTCKHWFVERPAGWLSSGWVCEHCGVSLKEYRKNIRIADFYGWEST